MKASHPYSIQSIQSAAWVFQFDLHRRRDTPSSKYPYDMIELRLVVADPTGGIILDHLKYAYGLGEQWSA